MLKDDRQIKKAYAGSNASSVKSVNIYPQYHAYAVLLPFTLRQVAEILDIMLDAASTHREISGVDLHLLDDRQMASANCKYFHRPGPTNIISFPQHPPMAGILLLSLDTFTRECRIYGQLPRAHFIRLLSHGFGHLAGYGHGPGLDELSACCARAASFYYDSGRK